MKTLSALWGLSLWLFLCAAGWLAVAYTGHVTVTLIKAIFE